MVIGACAVALIVAYGFTHSTTVAAASAGPATQGYTLHIDADQHFGDAHPGEIAHHWCKTISPSLIECQLYDSDRPDARLVGVETIVPASVWETFPPQERALWHYHKVELQKIHATLPDTPKDQQAAIIASIAPTYGKVFILWDPDSNVAPVGQPSVTVLH
ncbi:MAG: DUF1264 domain-containing protein [Candidatus Eremiobacteraeota bacterium]|nr:DUF1264 domain-containing protein [Candidatus Eremiobacteraeota bacterium]